MRILSLTAQKPDSTGSGVFLSELVRCFAAAGHQQAVIFGCTRQDNISLPDSVQVFPVYYHTPELPFAVCGMSDEMPYESTRYRVLTEDMTRQLFSAFRKAIRQSVGALQPDVIFCHHLYFLAALAREMYPDIPIYGQCHGSDLRQFRKNPWQRTFIGSQIPKLDGIFALHQDQKQMICQTFQIPEDKVTVMGAGYNGSIFRILPEVQAKKAPDTLRLIFAGKLSEKKGVLSLLEAMDLLAEPDRIELRLAGGWGDPEEYDRICMAAEKAPCPVVLPGRLSQQELARQMNECDVFVLPSFYEGLPLVLLEAMACGLKTICTDLPGIRPWLDRMIPENGAVFVEPPGMHNEDEPVPESLPGFARRLADAIEQAKISPQPDPAGVSRLSWKELADRYCEMWK